MKRPTEAGSLRRRLRRGPTVGIVSKPETIFTAALSGLPGNKASIDPPNEPTQQSLLLDLYLLKSGEEKSSSFSTFPGICRLIDCFARAVCIFWNAWDWKILECESFYLARTVNVQKCVQVTAEWRHTEKVGHLINRVQKAVDTFFINTFTK